MADSSPAFGGVWTRVRALLTATMQENSAAAVQTATAGDTGDPLPAPASGPTSQLPSHHLIMSHPFLLQLEYVLAAFTSRPLLAAFYSSGLIDVVVGPSSSAPSPFPTADDPQAIAVMPASPAPSSSSFTPLPTTLPPAAGATATRSSASGAPLRARPRSTPVGVTDYHHPNPVVPPPLTTTAMYKVSNDASVCTRHMMCVESSRQSPKVAYSRALFS